VVQRYLFAISYVWMQDLLYLAQRPQCLPPLRFLRLCLRAITCGSDIFYRPAKMRTRALQDLIEVVLYSCCPLPGRLHLLHAIRGSAPGAYHERVRPTSAPRASLAGRSIFLKTFIIVVCRPDRGARYCRWAIRSILGAAGQGPIFVPAANAVQPRLPSNRHH